MAVKISSVLLVLCALVAVPMALHDFAMLLANENFGWGVFGVMFIEGPLAMIEFTLALVLTFSTARAWAIGAWCLTALSAVSVSCVLAFGKASGC